MGQVGTWQGVTPVGQRVRARGWLIARTVSPWLVLLGLAVAALVLRLWAIHWRLPYTMNVDEPVVMDQAAAIVRTGDLNPHRFVYPSLQIYLQAAIDWAHLRWGLENGLYTSLGDLPENSHVITTAPGFYLWGRAGTAVLGALTVLLTGLAGRWLGGWRVGLIAALLLAVSPLHVGHSRFVTPDVPASCFTALALVGALAVWRWGGTLDPWRRRGLYALAGAAFGLATATKYNAVVIGLCLLLAHLLARPPRAWARGIDLWLAGAASLLAFFAVTPFAVLDRETFVDDVASIIYHYKVLGHPGFESDQNWWWYVNWLWRNEFWLIAPALAGAIWAALRHRGSDLLLLIFPLVSYAGLASYKVHFDRNLLPLFPFFALLAARLVVEVGDGLGQWWPGWRRLAPVATGLVGLALALGPARASIETTAYLARPDSRVAAVAWVRTQVPPTALVLADLDPQLWEGVSTIHAAQFVSPLLDQPLEWFSGHGYGYLVLNEDRLARVRREPARFPRQVAAYERLMAETEEVARFSIDDGYIGPVVRVLRLEVNADRLVMGQPLAARLGTVELLGATLGPVTRLDDIAVVRGGAPPSIKAGAILGLTLYWRPSERLDTDYAVFVHVIDDQGRKVAQRDTMPVSGRSPTSGWQPGQVVIDPANVPLPATLPPGTYRVIVGLYRPADGRRLPVHSTNPALVDAVEVGRARVSR